MVELGKKYRDTVTGVEGIATARTEWLNGCVRIVLESAVPPGGKMEDAINTFDIERLVAVAPPKEKVPVGGKGGGGRIDPPRTGP